MNYNTIKRLQRDYGYNDVQEMINSGIIWSMEGSMGRQAMSLLESGACMLPKESHKDYYGNRVPSRDMLEDGTKGTFGNCKMFWQGVEDGSIFIDHE